MSQDKNQPVHRLSTRQRQIVEHVVRDRLTTNEIVRERFFDECHFTAVTRATAELCSLGWLTAFPLVYPTQYYRLGKRAASAFGLTMHSTLPLGPQALPTEYAILRYTATHQGAVQRLTSLELQERHPWYELKGILVPHCLRRSAERSITELIRVDLGGPADHIARKCKIDINARFVIEEFRELLANGEFQLVIITSATEKASMINSALKAHDWPKGMLFRLVVFTDLLPIITRSF